MGKIRTAVLWLVLVATLIAAGASAQRTRIVGPRGTQPAFDPLLCSHPSGGWPLSYVLTDVERVSGISYSIAELRWELIVTPLAGHPFTDAAWMAGYPRKSPSGGLDVAVFRSRPVNNLSRHCFTQLLTNAALTPDAGTRYQLDMSTFSPDDSLTFEHYTGYRINLNVYAPGSDTPLPLNGGAGLWISVSGSTHLVPRSQVPGQGGC